MADFFFFTDIDLLNNQTSGDEYGPVAGSLQTNFRLTSMHKSSSDSKAYAVTKGTVFVQEITTDPTLVNLILKPTSQSFLSEFKIKYIIYRGIKKDSLISGTIIAPRTTNDLTNTLWESQDAINIAQSTSDSPPSSSLGINITASAPPPYQFLDTEEIDSVFFRNGTFFQLPNVEAGWKIGLFNMASFGIQFVIDGIDSKVKFTQVRSLDDVFIVTPSASSTSQDLFIDRNKKEYILNFFDPCALFATQFGKKSKCFISTDSDPIVKTSVQFLNEVITKFNNKTITYLDIRNEHEQSINYYFNYQDDVSIDFNNQSLPQIINYYSNSWPILKIDQALFSATTSNKKNLLNISLPLGSTTTVENPKPVVYLSYATRKRKISLKLRHTDKFISPDVTSNNFSSDIILSIPNESLSTIGTTVVPSYIKIKLLKSLETAPTSSSPFTLLNKSFLDNIFSPFHTGLLWPSSGETKSAILNNDSFVDTLSQYSKNFISNTGIAKESNGDYTFIVFAKDMFKNNKNVINKLLHTSGESLNLGNKSYLENFSDKFANFTFNQVNLDFTLQGGGLVPFKTISNSDDEISKYSISDAIWFTIPTSDFSILENIYNSTTASPYNSFTADFDKAQKVYTNFTNLIQRTDDNGVKCLEAEIVLTGYDTNTAVKEIATGIKTYIKPPTDVTLNDGCFTSNYHKLIFKQFISTKATTSIPAAGNALIKNPFYGSKVKLNETSISFEGGLPDSFYANFTLLYSMVKANLMLTEMIQPGFSPTVNTTLYNNLKNAITPLISLNTNANIKEIIQKTFPPNLYVPYDSNNPIITDIDTINRHGSNLCELTSNGFSRVSVLYQLLFDPSQTIHEPHSPGATFKETIENDLKKCQRIFEAYFKELWKFIENEARALYICLKGSTADFKFSVLATGEAGKSTGIFGYYPKKETIARYGTNLFPYKMDLKDLPTAPTSNYDDSYYSYLITKGIALTKVDSFPGTNNLVNLNIQGIDKPESKYNYIIIRKKNLVYCFVAGYSGIKPIYWNKSDINDPIQKIALAITADISAGKLPPAESILGCINFTPFETSKDSKKWTWYDGSIYTFSERNLQFSDISDPGEKFTIITASQPDGANSYEDLFVPVLVLKSKPMGLPELKISILDGFDSDSYHNDNGSTKTIKFNFTGSTGYERYKLDIINRNPTYSEDQVTNALEKMYLDNLITYLLAHNITPGTNLYGNGIGRFSRTGDVNSPIERDPAQTEGSYDGGKETPAFKNKRISYFAVTFTDTTGVKGVNMKINSFTDEVKSVNVSTIVSFNYNSFGKQNANNFKIYRKGLSDHSFDSFLTNNTAVMGDTGNLFSENHILSALRSFDILQNIVSTLKKRALDSGIFNDIERAQLATQLDSMYNNAKTWVGYYEGNPYPTSDYRVIDKTKFQDFKSYKNNGDY